MAAPTNLRPSLPELFVTNLRLLDLHHRPDWPNISPRVLSAKDILGQNQKTRIRCTEWALYRLFDLWDPAETRDKLQPFFPVLEPLQSLNLRNALYRLLADLKKNGVLGKETILRKTMLDECKGDKFMEALVVFSTAVVQKIAVPRLAEKNAQRPVALDLAGDNILGAPETETLIPLAIAHGASLTSLLRQKTEVKVRCQQFADLLNQKSDQLTQRTMLCNNAIKPALSEDYLVDIEKHIKENWPGNSRWPRTLLYGDDTNPGDQPLKRSFPVVWDVIASGTTFDPVADCQGLVQDLERRITDQRSRLQKWRSYHHDLSHNAFTGSLSNSNGPSRNYRAGFQFEKHVDLKPKLTQPQPKTESSGRRYIINAKLETIVADLRQQLDEATRPRVHAMEPIKPIVPMGPPAQKSRPASVSFSNHVSSQMSFHHHRGLSGNVGLTHSSTAVPLSRVFSPAKTFRLNGRSISSSSTEATVSSTTTHTSVPERSEPTPPPTPKVTLPAEHDDDQDRHSALSGSNASDLDTTSSHSGDDIAEVIIDSILNAQATPAPGTRPTLTDRTRQSMSQANPNFQPSSQFQAHLSKPYLNEAHSAAAVIADGTVEQRRSSLLERTQQSMFNLNDGQSRSRKSLAVRKSRNSIAFPVNQFETPGRPRPQPMRNATPTEKLFSDEAEYTSVFRSRPRVAYSPGPSPNGEDLPEAGDVIYEEMEDDSMMEDVDGDSWVRSSPLRGRGQWPEE